MKRNFVAKVEYEVFKKPLMFGFNWKEWLTENPLDAYGWGEGPPNDAIVSSTWTIPVNLAKEREAIKGTTTSIYLSGGALCSTHEVVNQIVTRDGVLIEATMTIVVMEDPITIKEK